jgi:REP element-mobilizing transposase RayT
MPKFRSTSYNDKERFDGKHRFEHWYRDNSVYFITARCRDRFPAFESEEPKAIVWDRFYYYTAMFGFIPWITALLDNHYHTIGYLRRGEDLGKMMQRLHGSVSKLVNDLLPERRVPFFRSTNRHDYFDGCLRDFLQGVRTLNYFRLQAVRHGIVTDYRDCPHTVIHLNLNKAIFRAVEINAFLSDVPYARYARRRSL